MPGIERALSEPVAATDSRHRLHMLDERFAQLRPRLVGNGRSVAGDAAYQGPFVPEAAAVRCRRQRLTDADVLNHREYMNRVRATRTSLPAAIVVALMVLTGCATESPQAAPTVDTPVTTPSQPVSPPATAPLADIDYAEYLEAAVNLMEARYFDRANVDWAGIRAATTDVPIDEPVSAAAAQRRLSIAFGILGDMHSAYIPPEFAIDYGEGGPADGRLPSGDRIAGAGYIALPAFDSVEPEAMEAYLDAARASMVAADDPEPACGWVIDLRDNTGGNMYPMLGAVSGLMGEGRILAIEPGARYIEVSDRGRLQFARGTGDPWSDDALDSPLIEVAESGDNDGVLAFIVGHEPHLPATDDPPVAVLVSNVTASAAEFVVVAFQGRADTRTFGTHTTGVPTDPDAFRMADSAILRLAVAAAVDRDGVVYTDSIVPDQLVADTRLTGGDAVLDAAVEWLHQTGSRCR